MYPGCQCILDVDGFDFTGEKISRKKKRDDYSTLPHDTAPRLAAGRGRGYNRSATEEVALHAHSMMVPTLLLLALPTRATRPQSSLFRSPAWVP